MFRVNSPKYGRHLMCRIRSKEKRIYSQIMIQIAFQFTFTVPDIRMSKGLYLLSLYCKQFGYTVLSQRNNRDYIDLYLNEDFETHACFSQYLCYWLSPSNTPASVPWIKITNECDSLIWHRPMYRVVYLDKPINMIRLRASKSLSIDWVTGPSVNYWHWWKILSFI